MKKWEQRILVLIGAIIALACLIVPHAWSAIIFPVKTEIPDGNAYRVIVQKYAFATLVQADTVLNCDSLNRSYSLNPDTNYNINLMITANAGDSAYSVPFLSYLRFSSASVPFRTPIFSDEYADSVRVTLYVNGAFTGTDRRVGNVFNYDTTYTFTTGSQYNAEYNWWFPGEDEPSTVTWPYYADTIGGSGATQTVGDVNYALVYGTLYWPDGSPVVGAVVEVSRVSATNAALATSSGTRILIAPLVVATTSNTSGYFSLRALRSNQYTATGDMKYNIRATYAGAEIFSLKSLTIPSSGNINVADTVAGRQ